LRDVIRLEVLSHLRRMVRRNRTGWPTTRITFRVDGHYARPEAMTRREDKWERLHLRPARHQTAHQEDRGGRRYHPHRPRFVFLGTQPALQS
jgi:hypothetical protein